MAILIYLILFIASTVAQDRTTAVTAACDRMEKLKSYHFAITVKIGDTVKPVSEEEVFTADVAHVRSKGVGTARKGDVSFMKLGEGKWTA